MGTADLHIHTDHGDGVDSVSAILDYVATSTGLDVIAITEHDRLDVALAARELWAQRGYRFDFVPGVEVTTLHGHLVALYVEEPIASLRPIEETVEAVQRQGGICFVPHPMSPLVCSAGPAAMQRLSEAGLTVAGLELFSANPTTRFYLQRARRWNQANRRLPALGASDAHFVQAIGTACTTFEGTTAADLRHALLSGAINGEQHAFPSLREVGLIRALRVPLAALAGTPRRLGWRATAAASLPKHRPPG